MGLVPPPEPSPAGTLLPLVFVFDLRLQTLPPQCPRKDFTLLLMYPSKTLSWVGRQKSVRRGVGAGQGGEGGTRRRVESGPTRRRSRK